MTKYNFCNNIYLPSYNVYYVNKIRNSYILVLI